jgi:hypothetical protein
MFAPIPFRGQKDLGNPHIIDYGEKFGVFREKQNLSMVFKRKFGELLFYESKKCLLQMRITQYKKCSHTNGLLKH